MEDLFKDIEFIVELEKMKNIFRRTMIIGSNRRENDAEHSWHISIMALLLEKYSINKVDINRVIQMLLIHDIVEIYSGDTFAYDNVLNKDKLQRELNAMEIIKSKLSFENREKVENLWHEFEDKITNESKFANAMDRIQPMLSNIYSGNGGTWTKYDVKIEQVLKRMEPIKDFNMEIYNFILKKANYILEC